VPRLGDIPIQRLTTARVAAFYGELVANGGKGGRPLSLRRCRYVHTTLRRALRDAVADGLVVRNVAAQARPPVPAGSRCIPGQRSRSGPFLRQCVKTGCILPGFCWQRWECVGRIAGPALGDVEMTSGRIAIRHTLVMVDRPFHPETLRACSSARPSGQGCRRSDCMTSGTRSRRSC